jgi:hypothetical protein
VDTKKEGLDRAQVACGAEALHRGRDIRSCCAAQIAGGPEALHGGDKEGGFDRAQIACGCRGPVRKM